MAEAGCPHLDGFAPLSPEQLRDPYPVWRRARAEAPVFHAEREGWWVVSRRADVLAALRDPETFSVAGALKAPAPPAEVADRLPQYPWARTLNNLEGPEHRRARKAIQSPFTPRNLERHAAAFRSFADELLRARLPHGGMDVVGDLGLPFSLRCIGSILGLPEQDHELLLRGGDATFRILHRPLSHEQTVRAAEEVAELVAYLEAFVESRHAEPQDDFTSAMLRAYDDDQDEAAATTAEVAQHVFTIVGGGFETSADLVTHTVHTLLGHPEQWEQIKADRTLIPQAVEEILRFHGPGKSVFRTTTSAVELGGARIPADARVCLLLGSANHDEALYERAEQFDVHRPLPEDHLGFGRWLHFCPGAPMARLEGRIVLASLADHVPDMRLAAGRELEFKADLQLHSIVRLDVEWDARDRPAAVR